MRAQRRALNRMDDRIIRGRVLTFREEPHGPDDHQSYSYTEDGAVHVSGGKIVSTGQFSDVAGSQTGITIDDQRPNLILPGFIDTHCHFPQMQVIASWGAKLLDWLNTYTFPEEMKFADPEHCSRIARCFFDELIRQGTTTAVAYCTVHPESVEAFFQEAKHRNLRVIAGKVLMDRNAPSALCDTPQRGYDESKSLYEEWHDTGRCLYAVTPRFAITSTPEQLELTQALLRELPGAYLQTHLSENSAEIESTLDLFPKARDYLDVYEHYELLGKRSLMGHSIHLNGRERGAMANSGSVAVFCPTSNLFLGSGLYDEATLSKAGVRTAIATDVGGGTNYSMLRTMDEGYKVLQLRDQNLHPFKSYYWSTLGNARALSLEDKIGTLEPGSEADIIILDSRATPVMALRMETVNTLAEELFVLQTLGDDRAIRQTYIAGSPSLPAS